MAGISLRTTQSSPGLGNKTGVSKLNTSWAQELNVRGDACHRSSFEMEWAVRVAMQKGFEVGHEGLAGRCVLQIVVMSHEISVPVESTIFGI